MMPQANPAVEWTPWDLGRLHLFLAQLELWLEERAVGENDAAMLLGELRAARRTA